MHKTFRALREQRKMISLSLCIPVRTVEVSQIRQPFDSRIDSERKPSTPATEIDIGAFSFLFFKASERERERLMNTTGVTKKRERICQRVYWTIFSSSSSLRTWNFGMKMSSLLPTVTRSRLSLSTFVRVRLSFCWWADANACWWICRLFCRRRFL